MSREKLARAISLIKAGKKGEGGNILANLLTVEPNNEVAWLWLFVCADTKERKAYCLKMALQINPERVETRKALEELIDSGTTNEIKPSLESATQLDPIDTNSNKIDFPEYQIPESPINSLTETKDNADALPKKHKARKRKEKEPEIVDLAKQNIQKVVETSKRKGGNEEPKETTIPFIPPTIIIVRPGENLFADDHSSQGRFPRLDSSMVGSTLFVDGLRINAFNLPKCLKVGHILDNAKCDLCDFFSASECAIRDDPYLLDEVRIFLAGKRQQFIEYRNRKKAVIRAIYVELKAHGRPLHYSVLAQIVRERHSQLGLTERGILRTMTWHPEIFESVSEGVYQCKKNNR